jgi:hypothetical protein
MPDFTDIEGRGEPPKPPRSLTPDELVAVVKLFWMTSQLVRRTVADWMVTRKRPTRDDLMWLAQWLDGAETSVEALAEGPETDGHSLDGSIRGVRHFLAKLDSEQ